MPAPLMRLPALVLVGVVALAAASSAARTATPVAAQERVAQLDQGRHLYLRDCAGCHGPAGEGSFQGTPLVGVGAASAHFWVSTGRMPIDDVEQRPVRQPPAYDPQEIDALVRYVASFGEGPPIPEVDLAAGDLTRGGVLYRLHCAPCHGATGIGGALAYGELAPSVFASTPVQVAESLIVAPGAMPAFAPSALDPEEVNSVVRYVEYLKDPEHSGGFPLGRAGRVDEGLVAWVVGVAGLALGARWIARRQ